METTEETTTNTTTKTRSGNGSTPPAKPGSNSSTDSSTVTNTGDTGTSTSDTSQVPEEFDGQPPEMCDPEDEDCEMPEMPDGAQGMGPGGDGNFPGAMTGQDTSTDSVLHPIGYLSLGAGSLIVAMVIAYACFSKFFHKKPGQTFDKGSKFVWYIVVSLILTAGLIALCYFIPIWTT